MNITAAIIVDTVKVIIGDIMPFLTAHTPTVISAALDCSAAMD